MVGLLEPGVGHHEPSVVEDEVADEPVHEGLRCRAELVGLALQLCQRLGQAVGHGDLGALERAHQLGLVVARDTQRRARRDHAHDEPEHTGCVRAPVDQVADEDGLPTLRVGGADGEVAVVLQLPAELGEEGAQLGGAAVDVADDVERPVDVRPVVPRPLAGDRGRSRSASAPRSTWTRRKPSFLRRPSERLRSRCCRATTWLAEVAIVALLVALDRHRLGYVEHDRVDQHVVAARPARPGRPARAAGRWWRRRR